MRLVVLLLAAMLLASGCGERDGSAGPADSDATTGSTPSATASTPAPRPMPSCSQVWVADKRFPQSYRGCETQDGTVVSKPIRCESGQLLHTFRDRFYAVAGGKAIRGTSPLSKDPQFVRVQRACTA